MLEWPKRENTRKYFTPLPPRQTESEGFSSARQKICKTEKGATLWATKIVDTYGGESAFGPPPPQVSSSHCLLGDKSPTKMANYPVLCIMYDAEEKSDMYIVALAFLG